MVKENKVTVKKTGYDWKIGVKKAGINAGIVICAGLIVVWQDDVRFMALIPVIKMVENYLKNK